MRVIEREFRSCSGKGVHEVRVLAESVAVLAYVAHEFLLLFLILIPLVDAIE